MSDLTTSGAKPQQKSWGFKVLTIVAALIVSLFWLALLLMTGFIIFVPFVAFLVWLFRQYRRNNLKSRWRLSLALFVASMALSGFMGWAMFRSTRRPDRYLIPQGYVGWVIVEYEVKAAPALQREDGHDLYKIPGAGRLETSSPHEDGAAHDEYFYIGSKGRRAIPFTGWGDGGMIWGSSISDGSIGVGDDKGMRTIQTPPTETFFVGTEQQFQKAGAAPYSKQMQKIIDST